MICMECYVSTIINQFGSRSLLVVVLLLVVLLLCGLLLGGLLLALGGIGVSLLLAGPHAAPLGQLGLGPLVPLAQLLLPHRLEPLGADDLGAALVQLLPVAVGSGVRPPLVLGEHVDFGRVGAAEGLGVQALLDGLVSELELPPLVELLQLVVLVHSPLLVIVFVSLQLEDCVPDGVGFVLQLVRVHGLEGEGLDADAEGDLHLLLHLLLGLGHLLPGVHGGGLGLLAALLLLSGHHLLALPLCLLHVLLLLLGLGLLLLLLLPFQCQLLSSLLLGGLLLLLGPDLLPLGLLLLEPLKLLLLLAPLVSPLKDVILQLGVQLGLLGLSVVPHGV